MTQAIPPPARDSTPELVRKADYRRGYLDGYRDTDLACAIANSEAERQIFADALGEGDERADIVRYWLGYIHGLHHALIHGPAPGVCEWSPPGL